MAISIKPLESITSGLGYICVFWAWLERSIDEMIEVLVPLEKGDISRAVTASADQRGKVELIRAAAFVHKIDDKWFKKLEAVLDEIDRELRPKRNRFVHDVWIRPSGRLERLTKRTKFTRPQAFARTLSTEQRTPVKMSEVWSLARKILSAQIKLVRLQMEYEALNKLIEEEVAKGVTKETARKLAEKYPLLPLLTAVATQSGGQKSADIQASTPRARSRKHRKKI